MKKTIIAAMLLVSAMAFAQEPGKAPKKGQENMQERVQASRIAFITQKLDLSVKEAQVFWPVYDKIDAERKEAEKNLREATRNLNMGLKNQAGDKDIAALTEAFVKAKVATVASEEKYLKEFSKVLPAEKVAKLYTAEERFRREQIMNIRGPQGGGRPDMQHGQSGQRGPRNGDGHHHGEHNPDVQMPVQQ